MPTQGQTLNTTIHAQGSEGAADAEKDSPADKNKPESPPVIAEDHGKSPAEPKHKQIDIQAQNQGDETSDQEQDIPNETASDDSDSTDSFVSDKSIVTTYLRTAKPSSIFRAYKSKLSSKRPRAAPQAGDEASTLVEGLIDYLRVLEDRVADLEDQIKSSDDSSDSDAEPLPPIDDTISVVPTIKLYSVRAPMQYHPANRPGEKRRWQAEAGTYECEHDTQHLIRAVYMPKASENTPDAQLSQSPQQDPENPDNIDEIVHFSVMSNFIHWFLSRKLNLPPLQPTSPIGAKLGSHTVMRFRPPYRAVLTHLDDFMAELQKLEGKYGRPMSPDERPPTDHFPDATTGPPPPPSPIWDCPAGLIHFRVYVNFIHKYLAPEVQFYRDLRAARVDIVAFEHLWMLFEIGDTIYCPLRDPGREFYLTSEGPGKEHRPIRRLTPQGYRIAAVEGGLPLANMVLMPRNIYPSDHMADRDTPEGIKQRIRRPPMHSVVKNAYSDLRVYCYYIDFNGKEYGSVSDVFVFKPYDRELEIRSLQVYPVAYANGSRLLERGLKFMDATVVSHMQYEGLTVGANREEINSPVVVDTKLAFEGDSSLGNNQVQAPKFDSRQRFWLINQPANRERSLILPAPNCFHPRCQMDVCIFRASGSGQANWMYRDGRPQAHLKSVLEEQERAGEGPLSSSFRNRMMSADLIRLLPGSVPAFALRNRKWVLLDLDLLKPVEHNHEWKNLVLPKGHRKMVQAMVETHTAQSGGGENAAKTVGMDLVRGKGKGCIILLHGVPGVGKTSTAECVAAHTNKPLYPITCGDIGYRPEDVERNMESHFKLAHKWGCVLLLDEADVFLAKRDQRDVQRNGLVSVFLRILEYYSGILFLTTNRVGAIDDAFRSRLHLTLYYPRLNKEQTIKIFKRNFKRIVDINEDRKGRGLLPFEYQKSDMKGIIRWAEESWKKLRWNGRQIRNTFQTVLALAEFDARGNGNSGPTNPVMTKSHFKIVASASVQFNLYLKQTHGHDEDEIAKRDLTRASNFSLEIEDSTSDEDSSSSEQSNDGNDSGTERDSEETDDDSDHGKKKKGQKKAKRKDQKGSKKGRSGKSGSKKAKGDEEGKKRKQRKKKEEEKAEEEEEDESESESDDSE
ncbi:hypothetical protein QBC38DRAFT_486247 [Podospora fimiseda]|uniref:AAA+ ATPase domain-containing protein n=1 Tax=Podospora fimiseda TaxID=252190 RepID=A0AAN7GQ82_9PEZI|nr:hypothetical protein QBC38DRAFT_486247 [Podospora fimiseda]